MVSPKHLGHLVLRVQDVSRSEKFYTHILGLEVVSREFGMVFLRASASRSHELALAPLKEGISASTPSQGGLSHFAWQMESLDDLRKMYRHLKQEGVEIAGKGDHGISIGVYFLDPDGNRIEVFYELPQESWPSDRLFTGEFSMSLDEE
jgi:catechol 2,3-dioxygenase